MIKSIFGIGTKSQQHVCNFFYKGYFTEPERLGTTKSNSWWFIQDKFIQYKNKHPFDLGNG